MAGRRISRLAAALTILTVSNAHAAQRQETKGKAGEVAPSLRPVAAQLASGAEQALRQGDYPAAIRGFEALVKMAPRVAEFRANLGMAYYSAHEFPDAARAFEEALKLDPRLLNPHYFLGLSLSKGGRCKEALGYLGKDYPRAPEAQLKREIGTEAVRCGMASNQPDKAVDFLRLMNRDFPDDPDVLYLSSHVYSDLSTLASERLLSTAPGSVQAHQMNAEILEFQGKPEEAVKEYRKILASNPNLPGIHYHLGRALLAGPQNPTTQEEARGEFEEELKINPADALSEYELGEMARKARQWNEAIERFSRAVKVDRAFTDARIGLGKSLLSAGRSAEAVEPLEGALGLEPDNLVAHYQLSLAYRRLGRAQDADKEEAAYRRLHQKQLATMDAIAGGITGRVSAAQTAEPPQ